MDVAIKGRWVKALRSGEYKQCQGEMHNGVGFCCMGVVCDVELDDWWIASKVSGLGWSIGLEPDEKRLLDGISRLPSWFLNAIDLEWIEQCKLIAMNDQDYTFDEIADWIEENL